MSQPPLVDVFVRRGGAPQGGGEAWDDTELIAAWNAQLQLLNEKKSQAAAGGDPHEGADGVVSLASVASTNNDVDDDVDEDDEEENEEEELSERSVSAQNAAVGERKRPREERVASNQTRQCREGRRAATTNPMSFVPPMPSAVAAEMHPLLRAWFLAGFETAAYLHAASGARK